MTDDLVTALLPALGRADARGFNVFNVMHHGTHEKQLSNVFSWLLDADGSHELGDTFLRIFVDHVNLAQDGAEPFTVDEFIVRQEVNVAEIGHPQDIADIVLESDRAVLVVENYYISDGHGHSYNAYLRYAQLDRRHGAVVMLCRDEDRALLADGWEKSCVVTYASLLDALWATVRRDYRYQRSHPEQYSFIVQMHRKFVSRERQVNDTELIDFVTGMCESGEAIRYGERPHDAAGKRFANDIAEQAAQRFTDGRAALARVKQRLRNYGAGVLAPQLDNVLGQGFVARVSSNYAGIYEWTINFASLNTDNESANWFQIKFGPSAWFANEKDTGWKTPVASAVADYSRLFVTNVGISEIRQSSVTLREVLDGLEPTDLRLRDEIVAVLGVPV